MGAASVRVDRPAERHPRLLRDRVERRARLHLVKANPQRLGGVEGADHGVTQTGEPTLRAYSFFQVFPSHEPMFAHGADARQYHSAHWAGITPSCCICEKTSTMPQTSTIRPPAK